MSVLVEVIIATFFSVILSAEEVEITVSEDICVQEQIVDVDLPEKCEEN